MYTSDLILIFLGVVGNILFNFGFVTTVPSWINEKKYDVSVNKSLWTATSLCIAIYLAIGIPGAIVYSDVLQGPVTATCPRNVYATAHNSSFNCPNDLMQTLTQPATAPWQGNGFASAILQTSVYMFPIVAVVSSIPVFSIVIKYNLIENGMSETYGFLWGVIFPWIISFPLLYMPNVLAQFVNLTSLVFVSFTDFIVPFALYIVLQNRQKESQRGAHADEETGSKTENLLGETAAEAQHSRLNDFESFDEVEAHHALPEGYGRNSPETKITISRVLGIALTMMSVVGFYLTVTQGVWAFDATTCSSVGN